MKTTSTKNNHVFEYAVIGANLTGLLQACALSLKTDNIVLIDSEETPGGFLRSVNTPIGLVNNGLQVFPNNESTKKIIREIEFLTQTPIFSSIENLPPLTFEGGHLKPFVGFGDFSFAFYDELSPYFSHEWIKTSLPSYEWPSLLMSKFKGTYLPRSFVTRFNKDENNEVHSLTLNGQKNLFAKNFVFSSSIKDFPAPIAQNLLNNKSKQKLSKTTFWTAIFLDILHEHTVTSLHNIHILNGTTQDEIGPCAGQFQTPVVVSGLEKQYSQWVTFMQDEEAEDTELVAAALKKIKRQIKRAHPQSLEGQKFERVLVLPSYSPSILPEFSYQNFFSGNSQLTELAALS